MIEHVKQQVYELLNNDNSGYDFDHINRVLELSLEFAKKENALDWINYLDNYLNNC